MDWDESLLLTIEIDDGRMGMWDWGLVSGPVLQKGSFGEKGRKKVRWGDSTEGRRKAREIVGSLKIVSSRWFLRPPPNEFALKGRHRLRGFSRKYCPPRCVDHRDAFSSEDVPRHPPVDPGAGTAPD